MANEQPRTPRVLGLLGGMGWASTADAYRQLNVAVNAARGGLASADLVLRSFDFAEVEALQAAGDWAGAGRLLGDAAAALADLGAGAILLCTNTMHLVADEIERRSGLPLIHIADATAAAVTGAGLDRVGLLGTRFTMEGEFYAGRLAAHGIDVVTPAPADRETVHRIIYDELVNEVITDASRADYLAIIERLAADGVTAVIAGCTEIELLVGPDDLAGARLDVRWFPTTSLHVGAGARWLLTGELPVRP